MEVAAKALTAKSKIRSQAKEFHGKSSVAPSGQQALQLQFHVHRSGNRIRAIRRNLPKTQFAVHLDRIFHKRLNCIEPHALIANAAGFRNDLFGDRAAQPFSAE